MINQLSIPDTHRTEYLQHIYRKMRVVKALQRRLKCTTLAYYYACDKSRQTNNLKEQHFWGCVKSELRALSVDVVDDIY